MKMHAVIRKSDGVTTGLERRASLLAHLGFAGVERRRSNQVENDHAHYTAEAAAWQAGMLAAPVGVWRSERKAVFKPDKVLFCRHFFFHLTFDQSRKVLRPISAFCRW